MRERAMGSLTLPSLDTMQQAQDRPLNPCCALCTTGYNGSSPLALLPRGDLQASLTLALPGDPGKVSSCPPVPVFSSVKWGQNTLLQRDNVITIYQVGCASATMSPWAIRGESEAWEESQVPRKLLCPPETHALQ